MHTTTKWQVEPSFKFDILCFLNTLTKDPYYLHYYQDEYNKFKSIITPAAKSALANLKKTIKDKNQRIISAFLCLYFSATNDKTLDDMLKTLENSEKMQNNLKKTPYYHEDSWELYELVKKDLKTVFLFLKDIQFHSYWTKNILPQIEQVITNIEKDFPKYNIIAENEKCLGFALPSNNICVYMLYYPKPHGIKITGTRFLTAISWPFELTLTAATHEMMHPPYDYDNDDERRNTLDLLKEDQFLMDKVLNHNPSFGYNSFEGLIEEDCVQALDQIISEKLKFEKEAHKRWKESDDGIHVFAVALYSVMKKNNYNEKNEKFRDFLIRMIKTEQLCPGKTKQIYDNFYKDIL